MIISRSPLQMRRRSHQLGRARRRRVQGGRRGYHDTRCGYRGHHGRVHVAPNGHRVSVTVPVIVGMARADFTAGRARGRGTGDALWHSWRVLFKVNTP